jgi:hypothetical protein
MATYHRKYLLACSDTNYKIRPEALAWDFRFLQSAQAGVKQSRKHPHPLQRLSPDDDMMIAIRFASLIAWRIDCRASYVNPERIGWALALIPVNDLGRKPVEPFSY